MKKTRKILTFFLIGIVLFTLSGQTSSVSGQYGQLEPISLEIRGTIIDNYVSYEYELEYDNTASDDDEEVEIQIPVHPQIRLSNMTLILNNKTYYAIIMPETEAQEQYNESVASNKTAVMISELSSGYEINFNIKAHSSAVLIVFFKGLLTRNLGEYILTIPFGFSNDETSPISLDFTIISHFNDIIGYGIEGLSPLEVENVGNGIHIEYNEPGDYLIPNQIDIKYRLADQEDGSQLLTYRNGTQNFFTYLLAPVIIDTSVTMARQFVFVLDTSGSMEGTAIIQAKTAFVNMINELTENDKFNVIEFNSDTNSIWTSNQIATTARKTEAKTWVNSLEAGGGTNFHQGCCLDGLASFVEGNELYGMLVLSDGQPTQGETSESQILSDVSEGNIYDVSISSVAFGSGASDSLMEQLATQNNGFFTFIEPDDDAATELLDFYKSFSVPGIDDYDIEMNGVFRLTNIKSLTNSSFYNGSEMVVAGCFNDSVNITTEITYDGETLLYENNATIPGTEYSHVEFIWAHLRIGYLLKQAIIDPTPPLEEEIVELAIYYGLVIKGYTALLLVVDEEEEPPDDDTTDDDSVSLDEKNMVDDDSYDSLGSSQAIPIPLIPMLGFILCGIGILIRKFKAQDRTLEFDRAV